MNVDTLNTTPKYFSAVHITRPKSASNLTGSSSFVSESPINQVKVAKLVLKPVQSKAKTTNNQPKKQSISVPVADTSTQKNISKSEQLTKKSDIELECAKASAGERKALNIPQQPSPVHKSKLDETTRNEAREFMKKQREKRKMEVKKEVDKSFVIKQRLEELKKSTKNAVLKNAKKTKSSIKKSPPKDDSYYSMFNMKMKEVKELKLKPMNRERRREEVVQESNQLDTSPIKFPASPKMSSPKKPPLSPKKQPSPLKLITTNVAKKRESSSAPSLPRPYTKENKQPEDDLKLIVPNVKLSKTTNTPALLNKTEVLTTSSNTVPFWLQNTIQPYPYNFIWAVRKKLEAYTSKVEEEKARKQISSAFETPQRKQGIKNARKLINNVIPELTQIDDDDNSETNAKSMNIEASSTANTISEISSIKSDVVSGREKKTNDNDDDDTTISESIFQSLSDDKFIGKKRESINSEFDRASFEKKIQQIENVSPNTSEKQRNFLHSTINEIPSKLTSVNDLSNDNKRANEGNEEEFKKMLLAFNKGLSHVMEVNHLLSAALGSKSSKSGTQTSSESTKKEYSSSFERNIESSEKSSNISEMVENLVQKSKERQKVHESESNSSIKTFIEDSESKNLKVNENRTIEEPPIVYQSEKVQELTSSATKVTTTEIVFNKLSNEERREEHETTLNESRLINMFKLSESEISMNTPLAGEGNARDMFNKSTSEIKSWERSLIERTRGQIAWLELQKQNYKKHGQGEKVTTIKKQQRAILMRLEKERSQLKEEMLIKRNESVVMDLSLDKSGNGSNAGYNIERILREREQKIIQRRKKIEYLLSWQKRLDEEEKKLKFIEQDLFDVNAIKLSKRKIKNSHQDVLNDSFEKAKEIDKSLRVLERVETAREDETVDVTGHKLNKLWERLTGVCEVKYESEKVYHLTKAELSKFYEDAKEKVLESDLKFVLEKSFENCHKLSVKRALSDSDVDTMNSIANIETEEEYAGSLQPTEEVTSSENDEELQQMMANQMKIFVDQKKLQEPPLEQKNSLLEEQTKKISDDNLNQRKIPFNQTYQVNDKSQVIANKSIADESTSTIGVEEMEFEQNSSPTNTEIVESVDISAVDENGSIIPEEVNFSSKVLQVTDMDQDDDNDGMMIEDISFPNMELSMNDTNQQDDDRNHDLSTITECTEYEQSQGSSEQMIQSEIASHSTTPSSERLNSEIEQRLISINDSLEQVEEAFKKALEISETPTYSTDKDFVESEKMSSGQVVSPSSEELGSASGASLTTSTPKILMPDVISDAETKMEKSED